MRDIIAAVDLQKRLSDEVLTLACRSFCQLTLQEGRVFKLGLKEDMPYCILRNETKRNERKRNEMNKHVVK